MKPPKDFELATMQDYNEGRIIVGTEVYLKGCKGTIHIRKRLSGESKEYYHIEYRMVIKRYIEEERLYIKK